MNEPVEAMSAEEFDLELSQAIWAYINMGKNKNNKWPSGWDRRRYQAVMFEKSARLRERDAAIEWGKHYTRSAGGGGGEHLIDSMLAARKEGIG